MALTLQNSYKMEYTRYRHYFHRIWVLYQKPSIKVSSALLLTLFTIIFFAAFAIRPTLVTVAELIKKIDDQQKVLDQMKKKSAALASAQQEYMSAQNLIPLLNQAVPQDESLPELITQIEGAAADHQVAYESFTLGDVTYAQNNTPHDSDSENRSITLSLSGNYETVKNFITDLIRLPRLLSVNTLSFGKPNQNSSSETNKDLQINLNLKTYHLAPEDVKTSVTK
jgi:Tfp pilus assembly protein PilO